MLGRLLLLQPHHGQRMTQQTPPTMHLILHIQRLLLHRSRFGMTPYRMGLRPAVGAAAFAFAISADGGGVIAAIAVDVVDVVAVVVVVVSGGGSRREVIMVGMIAIAIHDMLSRQVVTDIISCVIGGDNVCRHYGGAVVVVVAQGPGEIVDRVGR